MWRVLFILFSFQSLYAQELPSLFQDYISNQELSVDDQQLEVFYSLLEHPLDLNNCRLQELHQFPFLNFQQANAIIKYRRDKGQFSSLYELQAIEALKLKTIRLLLPFVTVSKAIPLKKSNYKHQLRFYLQRSLEQEKEYVNGEYLGNPFKSYAIYSARSKVANYGLITEKDAGEKYLDFITMYANLKHKNNRLFVGDYQLSLGQGLLCYQSFTLGKSAWVSSTFKNSPIFRSHTSTREYGFLRGIAYQKHWNNWQLSLLVSSRKQDANSIDSLALATSIKVTGLHRGISEYEDKRQLLHQHLGASINYKKRLFSSSLYGLAQNWDKSLVLGQDTLSQLLALGWDYSLSYKNTHLFGECVWQNNSWAFLSALNSQLSSNVLFSTLYRNYSSDYYALDSKGFGEQSSTRNERGLYSALSLDINRQWTLSLYADFYRFPQANFYSQVPSLGQDYLLQLMYKVSKTSSLIARGQWENKTKDDKEHYGLPLISKRQQHKYLLQWTYDWDNYRFKSRVNWNHLENERAYLLAQEMHYRPVNKAWSLSFRYLIFDSPSFASRIYAYEPDVMHSFYIPFHYGEGQRISTVFKYKFRSLTFNLKLAQTLYYDNTPIKSGSVEGNTLTEIKLALKWVL
ncbi:MAG: helix-hairpin-helix domain-containing protein [Flavobacteriales bacterium]|nr:helix-hairpin-helix domain-containing protein [Flavobacteriales bacterium]